MAATKRSPFRREADFVIITRLYLEGKSQSHIANVVGVSQQQISSDLKAIQKRWKKDTAFNLDEAKNRELARIDNLEATYWTAWENSCKKRVAKSIRQSFDDLLSGDSNNAIRTEERDGNPLLLNGVLECIKQRCKILGINAPEKLAHSGRIDTDTRIIIGDSDDDTTGDKPEAI